MTETAAYGEYLKDKPDMAGIIEMGPWIRPLNPHPAYHTIAGEWVHALARIFNEGAPVQQTLDDLAELIEEILADY
ncbi:MAG: hypothetical protein ACOX5D_11900 [Limnochordia bacterium]